MSPRSFTDRLRRRLVAAALFLLIAAGSLGLASTAGAAPRGERPTVSITAPAASRPAPRAISSSVVTALIRKLVQRLWIRGTAVVRGKVLRVPRHYTVTYLTNRYCSAWWRYFGYNARTWRYYAYYYANARWAWWYCSTHSWRYVA